MRSSVALTACLLIENVQALVPEPFFTYGRPAAERQVRFDWSSIRTDTELTYETCYDKFECARLQVPLDWRNNSSPHKLSLAIIRLPAEVPESAPSHGGTIIINPGGPGGSGVQQALQKAGRLQKLLNGPKHYEILSFDPRGIFHSKPNAYCFGSAVEAEIWGEEKRAVGALDSSDYALKYRWAAEKAHGELCANEDNGRFEDGENLRQHMSTAYVSMDMMEIVKKVGQRRVVLSRRDSQIPLVTQDDEKLQYLGTSYGTFLGQVFADMFPKNVKRMVLDANLDAENWMSKYEASVDDSAAIREQFFGACFAAGHRCALYREHDRKSDDVKSRFLSLIDALDEFPSYISGHGRATPITKADVLQGFFTTTYQPLWFFEDFAKFVNDLIIGKHPGPPFWQLPIPTQETFSDPLLINQYLGGEVGPSTHCSDGPPLHEEGLSGFRTYLSNLTSRYGWAGSVQADFKIPCWTWPAMLRTKWRYEGSFNASVPILFVNNRLDPATPIRSARKMSSRFTSSVVLEQNSSGHGSLWPASSCMWGHVKQYFDTGVLPPPDSVCEPVCKPFGGKCEGLGVVDRFAF